HGMCGIDALPCPTIDAKAQHLKSKSLHVLKQSDQLNNPDMRVSLEKAVGSTLLFSYADAFVGLQNGDTPRFILDYWEVISVDYPWVYFQMTCESNSPYLGRNGVLRWENGNGEIATNPQARIQGTSAWGRRG